MAINDLLNPYTSSKTAANLPKRKRIKIVKTGLKITGAKTGCLTISLTVLYGWKTSPYMTLSHVHKVKIIKVRFLICYQKAIVSIHQIPAPIENEK